YRGTTSGPSGGPCTPPSALAFVANTTSPQSFIDQSAPVNANLYYKVSATNAAGEGTCTNPAQGSATADPPTQPQGVAVSPFSGRNQVTWLAPADDGGTSIQQYRVWWNDQNDVGCNQSVHQVTLPSSQLGYNDTSYAVHVTRYYYVQALSQLPGACSPGVAVVNNVGKPSAPATLSATTSLPSFVWLNWTQPVDSGGLTVTSFYLYRTSGSTTNQCTLAQTLALVQSSSNLTWRDFNTLDGAAYHYAVSAVNQAGEGPCSAVVDGGIDPYVGQQLTLSADSSAAAASRASLPWNAIAGADAYLIYRAPEASSVTPPLSNSQYTFVTSVTTTTYSEMVSVTEHYRVQATSQALGLGPISNDAAVTICARAYATQDVS